MKKTKKPRKKNTKKELREKGWELQGKIVTGEIWKKGNKRIFYDSQKKEILHTYTV